jgi:lactate permease
MGFKPIGVAILCLIMNSVPVAFGAVGTPTWFGLGQLGLTESELQMVAYKTALIHSIAALIIPVIALRFVTTWKTIRENIVYIYLSILATVVPYLALASINVEFPSILGGFTGLLASVFFAKKCIGLKSDGEKSTTNHSVVPTAVLLRSSFPILGATLILLITRIKQLGLKAILNDETPLISFNSGYAGILSISKSITLSWQSIFDTTLSWSHKLLYVPSIIPFLIVSALFIPILPMKKGVFKSSWNIMIDRMKGPVLALLGALVFVKLLMTGNTETAPTAIIGNAMASSIGKSWQFFASYLGAIGAFFAGSNTVSNLTFAGIQNSIATTLSLDKTTILALQHVGGAMGNMVCINNIVAVCSVLGLSRMEGAILKKTVWPMLLYGLIAFFVSLFI